MDFLNIIWNLIDFPTLIIGLIVFWIVFVIIDRWHSLSTFKRMGIQGPKPHFIYGNLKEITTDRMKTMTDWIKKYGRIMGYYEGPRPVLLVADPETIKLIFIKYSNKFINRPGNPIKQTGVMGKKLTELKGDDWKRVRNTLTPSFSSKKLKQLSVIMNKGVNVLVELVKEKAQDNKQFDIYSLFQQLTMQVIGESVFAMDVNCLRDPSDAFLVGVRQFFNNLGSWFVHIAILFPTLGNAVLEVLSWISYDNQNLKPEKFLVDRLTKVINIRRQYKQKHTIDMLQLMLEAAELDDTDVNGSETSKNHTLPKSKMSEDEVIGNSFVFLLAGYETTANTLAYTAYNLTKHPKIQAEVQAEIDKVIGKKDQPDYDTVNQLVKLNQVISESLRMYPPVTLFVSRTCVEDCEINGLLIPKGMKVLIPVWQMHYDEEFWPEPNEFRPERVVSINVQGLNKLTKRASVLKWLKSSQAAIVCIQETKISESNVSSCELWKNDFFLFSDFQQRIKQIINHLLGFHLALVLEIVLVCVLLYWKLKQLLHVFCEILILYQENLLRILF